MLVAVTQFGTSTSGLGSLGVNGVDFLIQLVTFVLAYFLLRQFAFEPIMKIMQQRRDTIEKGVLLGEQMQKDRAKLDQEVAKQLHAARLKADAIIAQATESGRQAVRDAEDAARDKAVNILKEADSRIEQESRRARKQVEKDVVALISDATEAIIAEKVDATKDAALIDRVLKEQQTA
jgi:F-type H+-transporting ATPase subunit b